jgi:arylsulfatase A-like enzyme
MSGNGGSSSEVRRALCSLFGAAGVATAAVTLVKAIYLAETLGVGRLRDYGFLWIVRGAIEAAGFSRPDYLAWMSWAHEPHELSSVAELLDFIAAALAANLTVAFLLALPLVPFLVFGARLVERHRALATTGIFVGYLAPEVMIVLYRDARGPLETVLLVAGGAALAMAVAGLVAFLLLRPDAGRRTAGGLIGFGVTAVAVAALLFGTVSALIEPGDRVPASAARQTARPNVLFISIDTLRADHVQSYGYARETTPALDRLVAEGARFENAISPSSWTLPTHLTMLTALPPEAHGVVQTTGVKLGSAVVTLPELLWSEGYATAGFVSGGYLESQYGHAQGFDHYDDYSIPYLCNHQYRSCTTSPMLYDLVSDHLDHWEADGRERPFFIFLHMFDVHNDYLPPAPYDELFAPEGDIDFTVGMVIDGTVDAKSVTTEQRDHLIALYDGEIRATDEWVGRVLGRLEELDVLDDTVIIVTSDHGDEFNEHGSWGHHLTLYDASVRVPLIMRFPGKISGGRTIEEQASLVDLAPTLLALLDIDAPDDFGTGRNSAGSLVSRDLTPLLAGNASEWEESPAFGDLEGRLASIRTRQWKLIRDEEDVGALELYDLRADPGEHENVAASHPDVVERLSVELDAWRGHWLGDAGRHQSLEQGDEHLEQLRALGYIE